MVFYRLGGLVYVVQLGGFALYFGYRLVYRVEIGRGFVRFGFRLGGYCLGDGQPRLENHVARRVFGVPDDCDVVSVAREWLEAGAGGGVGGQHEQAHARAAVSARLVELVQRLDGRVGCVVFRLYHDFRAAGGVFGA